MSVVLRSKKTQTQRYKALLKKYGTLSHLWDFGVPQSALTYAASHTAAEFVAAYPLWPLWQDTAGTVPACKITDPVGLCLDQPTGVVTLGPELNTSRDFTGWSPQAGWSVSSGIASAAGAGAGTNIGANKGLVSGATYEITVVCSVLTAGSWFVRCGFDTISPSVSAAGSYTFRLPRGSNSYVYVVANTGLVATFTNISVREVIGAHASQATTTKRPILSGRVNLLTATEDFASASWTKNNVTSTSNTLVASAVSSVHGVAQSMLTVGVPYTLRCKFKANGYIGACISNAGSSFHTATINLNTGNITSGASITSATSELQPDGYWLLTCSFIAGYTTASIFISSNGTSVNTFLGNGVSGIYIKEAQCKPINSPTNIPAYQRVTSATDYDTVGFPVRALFDGVDDCLVVPSLDLSMTDKVTVVAGVTKLSDANGGMVCELTNDTNSYNGSLFILSPRSASYSEPAFTSKGTSAALAAQSINSLQAPRGMVLSATASISTDSAILSVNDSVYGTSAADQGTGNFSAGPFNIGARNGGASALFNGAIQSLAIIGNLLPDGEVQILEASANAAMGKVY